MEIKAITILTRESKPGSDDMKFTNAGFAISSDNVEFLKRCIEINSNGATYNGTAVAAFFHTTAYGIAAAIRHGIAKGVIEDPEKIFSEIIADIKAAMVDMENTPDWHEVRTDIPNAKGPSKN